MRMVQRNIQYGPRLKCLKRYENNRDSNNKVSIGKPILNTDVYLLSPEQRLVPIGAAGEIYIGGEGLARWICE